MNPTSDFYDEATLRNLGLVTEEEQSRLRRSTVAIAGLGAAGGHHLVALARLGVGGFSIADPDTFEVSNLHRQTGAFVQSLGQPKATVMADLVRSIQPDARLRVLESAVDGTNADAFLEGVDLLLDGIDFFQVDARREVFHNARRRGIPVITSGPLGGGASLLVFHPQGPSFDEYFGITASMTRAERIVAFGLGSLPGLRALAAIDPGTVNPRTGKAPALVTSVLLCSALATTEAMRVLLGRPGLESVPRIFYFDPVGHRVFTSNRRRTGVWDRWLRRVAMKRFPGMEALHREELASRANGSSSP